MVTTTVGRTAEKTVAEHLRKNGYKIRQCNWRIKAAEIDIVAEKDDVIYLVEVKYRSDVKQGSGFEHITATKRQQMEFAANMWAQFNGWDGDYRLLAAAVDGRSDELKLVEI